MWYLFALIESIEFSGVGKIKILECRNLKSVDKNGLSDPYVLVTQVYHGKSRKVHKTDAVKKSLNPSWAKNAEFTFKTPPVRSLYCFMLCIVTAVIYCQRQGR